MMPHASSSRQCKHSCHSCAQMQASARQLAVGPQHQPAVGRGAAGVQPPTAGASGVLLLWSRVQTSQQRVTSR
jgi:hypothetical protein